LKARSTKRVEIPVILDRGVVDPTSNKVIFDTYDGPLSSTIEFMKYQTQTTTNYNTLTFMPMKTPEEQK
jgi:hypothetical protein